MTTSGDTTELTRTTEAQLRAEICRLVIENAGLRLRLRQARTRTCQQRSRAELWKHRATRKPGIGA